MGGQADATEDMFSKLESMRAVITEVNTQFKDPVRRELRNPPESVYLGSPPLVSGKDDVCLRVYIRVPLLVRDGTTGTRTDRVRNRHSQYRSESIAISQDR
jgi:hypothetical protein